MLKIWAFRGPSSFLNPHKLWAGLCHLCWTLCVYCSSEHFQDTRERNYQTRPEVQFLALPVSRLCSPSTSINESLFLTERSITHPFWHPSQVLYDLYTLYLNSGYDDRIPGCSLGGLNNRPACEIRVSAWLNVSGGPLPRSLSQCPHVALVCYVEMLWGLHHFARTQIPKQSLPSWFHLSCIITRKPCFQMSSHSESGCNTWIRGL